MDFDALRKAEAARQIRQPSTANPTRAGDPAAFARALDHARAVDEPDTQQDLAPLLADIDEAAGRFAIGGTPEGLIEYKRVVRRFLEEFLARSHRRQKIVNFDPQAVHDHVLLVKVIDERLEALSRQFVSQEADQLQLLALLDEIRGLLVDCVA
ncbi:MAG: YaaR family protein [bacterium]